MIAATRRETLLGALAVPALAALPPAARAAGTGPAVLVYDPALETGRRLAAAFGGRALAIEGDPVRFARAVLAARPARIAGVSRSADALLIGDVAREAGYRPDPAGAAALAGPGGAALGWLLVPKA